MIYHGMQAGDEVLRTNDQVLSLTDQLNLGVRAVELDTHWVEVQNLISPLWHAKGSEKEILAQQQRMRTRLGVGSRAVSAHAPLRSCSAGKGRM
jgi:hypothetical protein